MTNGVSSAALADTLLNGELILHGIDVEHVARATLKRRPTSVRNSQVGRLTDEQHERLLSYLIIAAWQLSERYDPRRPDAIPFGHLLTKVLRCRVVDWLRAEYGDNRRARARGEHKPSNHPATVSLDAMLSQTSKYDNPAETDHGADGRLTVSDTLGSSALDPAECCNVDIERLLRARNGNHARHQQNQTQRAHAVAA